MQLYTSEIYRKTKSSESLSERYQKMAQTLAVETHIDLTQDYLFLSVASFSKIR